MTEQTCQAPLFGRRVPARLTEQPCLARLFGVVAFLVAVAAPATADPPKVYRFDPNGKVRAVRAVPRGSFGAPLVLLVDRVGPAGAATGTDVVILRARRAATGPTWFADADVARIPCDGAEAGPIAESGALSIARSTMDPRLGPTADLHFLGPSGVFRMDVDRPKMPLVKSKRPAALLSRSPGAPLQFWDTVLPLGEEGLETPAYPGADGRVIVGASALDLRTADEVTRADTDLFERDARVPSLRAADVDGDGKKELVGLVGTDLVVWELRDGAWAVSRRVPIPFLVRDPKLPPEEIRTPRLTIADVDGDGKADLLVTLVQGRADRLGGLRTSLYRFPGPFFDEKTSALVEPQSRLDTESVALHAGFVDVDGDGKLDYVADSIRGNVGDLIARIMGREPTTWYTVFRFDPEKRAFERKPFASVERPYPADEAKGNRFGRTGWLDGDFDGDGVTDLLDLGNLHSVTILAGTKSGEGAFTREILPKTTFDKPLATDAVIADLDGDGVSDAVLWNDDGLILIVSGRGKGK